MGRINGSGRLDARPAETVDRDFAARAYLERIAAGEGDERSDSVRGAGAAMTAVDGLIMVTRGGHQPLTVNPATNFKLRQLARLAREDA